MHHSGTLPAYFTNHFTHFRGRIRSGPYNIYSALPKEPNSYFRVEFLKAGPLLLVKPDNRVYIVNVQPKKREN